jgi:hypothetical protein
VEHESISTTFQTVDVKLVIDHTDAVGLWIVLVLPLEYIDGRAIADARHIDTSLDLGGAAVDQQIVVSNIDGAVDILHIHRVGILKILGVSIRIEKTFRMMHIACIELCFVIFIAALDSRQQQKYAHSAQKKHFFHCMSGLTVFVIINVTFPILLPKDMMFLKN